MCQHQIRFGKTPCHCLNRFVAVPLWRPVVEAVPLHSAFRFIACNNVCDYAKITADPGENVPSCKCEDVGHENCHRPAENPFNFGRLGGSSWQHTPVFRPRSRDSRTTGYQSIDQMI